MRSVLLTCFAVALILSAFRSFQETRVGGFVRDIYGKPIRNVIVTELQNKKTTRTSKDGSFSLHISGNGITLSFEKAGYSRAEFRPVNYKDPVNIILQGSDKTLSHVSDSNVFSLKKDKLDVELNETIVTKRAAGQPAPISLPMTELSGRDGSPGYFRQTPNSVNFNTEEYDGIVENRFLAAKENPLSTFSIDVDGGSYSNMRRFLQQKQMPPAGAVRTEELINYFHYEYPQPAGDDPFSINTEIGTCAWSPSHRLVMIGLQGRKIPMENLPPSNLVFLIDVSGSMMEPEKLPLVQRSLKMLVDQLREQDRVSLVVYAGNAGLVMPSTSGSEKNKIKEAIDRLEAGGSTAGGAGIQLAYKVAEQHFVREGNNRVILCTDGDFNVGPSSDSDLEGLIEKERNTGVFLTVLGFGMGNYKDSKMEKLADMGNGNHSYIDNENEAKKVLVNEFGGTLFTIAKDVKLQIEMNPAKVQAYRLIGYENRMLNKEDFNNDAKDAGELGSGHTVTALYEIIPVGVENKFLEPVDPLKYQQPFEPVASVTGDEIMNIKFRYKNPDGEKSRLIEHRLLDQPRSTDELSTNFRFVTAVAQFGMLLKNSEFKQLATYPGTYSLAKGALGADREGYRAEFLKLVLEAERMAKKENLPGEDSDLGIR